MLGIQIHQRNERTTVVVRGDVDLTVLPRLRAELIDAVHLGDQVVEVDLSGVPFLDSAGLGVLIGGLKRARNHGRDLIIVNPSARVRRVLELTDLDGVFGCRRTGSHPIPTDHPPVDAVTPGAGNRHVRV